MKDLNIKNELYSRYVDDIDLFLRTIGILFRFCPLAGEMLGKTEGEMLDDKDKNEDEITMEELRKVANSYMEMLNTEAECPSKHPELGYNVPILDLSIWLEETKLPAPWMQGSEGGLYEKCNADETCLPIGQAPHPVSELEVGVETAPVSSSRLVTQVCYQFYRKPMAPNRVMLSNSAQSWQQKRTTATQELIRRLLNTRKQLG